MMHLDCPEVRLNFQNYTRLEVAKCMGYFMRGGCLADLPWFIPAEVSCLVALLVVLLGIWFLVKFQVPEREQSEATAGPKERVFYIDNCRFVLETLVIAKHLVAIFAKHKSHVNFDCWWLNAFCLWCASFHMPLFAFCSGLLSKGYLTPPRAKRTIIRVAMPWLLLNYFVYPAKHAYLHMKGYKSLYGGDFIPTPFEREPISWFLGAWMIWRVLTGTFLSTLSTPFMLGLSYTISWISGYWFSSESPYFHVMGLPAAMAWLGIYATGFVIPLSSLSFLGQTSVRLCGALMLCFSLLLHFGLAYLSDPVPSSLNDRPGPSSLGFDYGLHFQVWLNAASRYYYFQHPEEIRQEMPMTYWLAWTQRLSVQFLLTWPTGLGLLSLVPQEKQFWTEWGSRTMYPYLLQVVSFFFLIRLLRSFFGTIYVFTPLSLCFLVPIVALLINIFWACSWTHSWAKYLLEPTWISGIFRRDLEVVAPTIEAKPKRMEKDEEKSPLLVEAA